MELYRKVIIKSEDDLPKHEMFGDGKLLIYHIRDFEVKSYNGYSSSWDEYFLKDIDWYLQPTEICTCGGYPDCICDITKVHIEQPEPVPVSAEEIRSTAEILNSKFPNACNCDWYIPIKECMEEYHAQFQTEQRQDELRNEFSIDRSGNKNHLSEQRQATDEEIEEWMTDKNHLPD